MGDQRSDAPTGQCSKTERRPEAGHSLALICPLGPDSIVRPKGDPFQRLAQRRSCGAQSGVAVTSFDRAPSPSPFTALTS